MRISFHFVSAKKKEITGFFALSFAKKRDAEDALDRMDGTDLDGREIRVQFARYGRASTSDSRDKTRRRR